MSEPEVRVFPDADAVAGAVADALIASILQRQQEDRAFHLVATGGGVGIAILACVLASPRVSEIDWSRVDVWWGDERYLPQGDPDRNDTQGIAALFAHPPADRARLHVMPAPTPDRHDADDAALTYADELAAAATPGHSLPEFDVLMLGIGPEGHVASLFPDSPGVTSAKPVVAVYECPKPPPTRISLTLPSLRSAHSVWIVAAGQAKAEAIALTVDAATDPVRVPAAGARGTESTILWIDRSAAADLR